MSSRDERWEMLYTELSAALTRFGKDVPSGEGDFWLVDDDWGGHHHKICITNPHFWSDAVQEAVRQTLASSFPDWGVFVVFEDGSNNLGFIVYADGIATEPRWI